MNDVTRGEFDRLVERVTRVEQTLGATVEIAASELVGLRTYLDERFDHQDRMLDALASEVQAEFDTHADILTAHGRTLVEHGHKLDEHGRTLVEHGRKLDEQGRKLDEQGRKLDDQGRKLDEQGRKLDALLDHFDIDLPD